MADIEGTETTEEVEAQQPQAESQDTDTEEQAAGESEQATEDVVAEDGAAEAAAEAVAVIAESAEAKESKPAPAPPAPDKGPFKAKLKALKIQRDEAEKAGDGATLKRVRARIRRLKRQLRKAG